MAVTFKGELTKHILKCYPNGKAHDKKPVANELSMLIFYLQTRPAKIPKAAWMLSTRARKFSAKDNSGNLTVTALIMLEIIKERHENFGLFAEGALEIIELLVDQSNNGNDPDILGLAVSLFTEFNRYHRGVLFAGNELYSQRFVAVTEKFVSISATGSTVSRVVALKGLTSLSVSPALATTIGQKVLLKAVKGFEVNFPHDESVYAAVTEATKEGELESPNNELGFNAVLGLREFLDMSSFDQTIRLVNRLLQWLIKNPGDWQPPLVAYMARWVPPQNRFLVTKSVVLAMASLSPDEVKLIGVYCSYLEALLKAEESKIGLSVVDVLRQLLNVQHCLIETPSALMENQGIQDLIVRLRKNIGYLANTRVYPDQTSDMLAEILSKYSLSTLPAGSTPLKSDASSSGDSKRSVANTTTSFTFPKPLGVIINDFKVIMEIQNSSPKEQRKLSLSLWEGTQWLLTSQHPQLLVLYTTAFADFVESARPVKHPFSKRGSAVIRQICDCARHELQPVNYIAIHYCLVVLIKFQSSSCHYFLPWVMAILPEESVKENIASVTSSVESKICRESVAFASLLAIFRISNLEKLAEVMFKLISARVDNSRWLPGITYPPAVSVEVAIAGLTSSPGSQVSFAKDDKADLGALADEELLSESLIRLLESSGLNQDDLKFIVHPTFAIDSPAESEDTRSVKNGNASISETIGKRSISNISQSSIESSAPRIGDLRKRQENVRNLRTMKSAVLPNREMKISLPTKRNSSATIKYNDVDLLSILENININGDKASKGNLTM